MNKLATYDSTVNTYVSKVKEDSENIILKVFPRKIQELNAILSSPDFSVENCQTFLQAINIPIPEVESVKSAFLNAHSGEEVEVPGKKRKLDPLSNGEGSKMFAITTGVVAKNSHISKLMDIVKPYIRELVENANILKMWVTFLIPKIEDGNNFGVSIQEETLAEIRNVEVETAAFYEGISRYYMTRGKIISKVAKYPHIEDYRRVITELDEKEVISLRIVLSEVRNHYAALYDLIMKNWEKIIRPRTSNAENLY